jgi:uncharacterized protein YndB with AHSA1/START domain
MTEQTTVTTPAEREIRIERIFEVPRERLFEVLTDPELIPRWWGPRGTTTIVEEMDPTKGGRWRFLMRDSDGTETRFSGTYREVSPPERIVQTFEWDGMPGHISLETMELEDLGERTRAVNVSVFHHASERDGMLESGMEKGLNETYERLDEVLAS